MFLPKEIEYIIYKYNNYFMFKDVLEEYELLIQPTPKFVIDGEFKLLNISYYFFSNNKKLRRKRKKIERKYPPRDKKYSIIYDISEIIEI